MELVTLFVELLPTVGFPILCCGALGWFIYKFYVDSQKQNKETMEQLQARCAEREEKLYKEIDEQTEINRKFAEINGRFAEIIAQYEVKLDAIKVDIGEIKADISVIKNM